MSSVSHRQIVRATLTYRLIAGVVLLFLASACPAQVGRLNDSGIVLCANATSNSVECSYANNDAQGFPLQDGQIGRSPKNVTPGQTLTKTGASASAGFDFTKLDATTGAVLTADKLQGTTAGTWGCTRDNVTGLTWETKVTTASNYRKSTNVYTWYNTTGTTNGGNAGTQGAAPSGTVCYQSARCDTAAYLTYINVTLATKLCGYTNWRLPTRAELMTIVDAAKAETDTPTVDSTYFPNVETEPYWTSDTYPDNNGEGRFVHMGMGFDGLSVKADQLHIMLVRP